MAINPNIPLQGRNFDFVSRYQQGQQNRLQQEVLEAERQSAQQETQRNQLIQALGIRSAQGDEKAQQLLAGIAPDRASGISDIRQSQNEQAEKAEARGVSQAQGLMQVGDTKGALQTLQELPESRARNQAMAAIQSDNIQKAGQMLDMAVEQANRRGILEQGPQQPSAVREYQFARQQGFEGSYQDWVNQQQGEGMALSVSPEGGVSFTQGGGTALPPAGQTEARNLRQAEVSTRQFINTTRDALNLLQEQPDVNTFMGRAAGIVNDLQQEAGGFARGLGLEFDSEVLDPSAHKETFDQLGIDNARMRSLITSLAFQSAAASGQTGRSVSDRDVQRFIQEIGASSADPRAFSQVLRDVASRTARNFQTNFEVRTGQQLEGDFGVDDLPSVSGQQEAQGEFSADEEALINKYLGDGNGDS